MEQSYWDMLERIRTAAGILQRHPVPTTDQECQQLKEHVGRTLAEMRAAMTVVAPHSELWCGETNDPLRQGRITATEWDYVMSTD